MFGQELALGHGWLRRRFLLPGHQPSRRETPRGDVAANADHPPSRCHLVEQEQPVVNNQSFPIERRVEIVFLLGRFKRLPDRISRFDSSGDKLHASSGGAKIVVCFPATCAESSTTDIFNIAVFPGPESTSIDP